MNRRLASVLDYGVVPAFVVATWAGTAFLLERRVPSYLVSGLVVGALAVIRSARARPDKYPWVMKLLGRRPAKVVAVALANKMARIAWAILAKGEAYRAPVRSSSGAIAASA